MGDGLLDVFPIGAKQAAQGNIVVPNLDGESFAEQMFDQLNLWTLSQIIGGSLEASARESRHSSCRYRAPTQ